jgi:hypothetical protein
MQCLKRQRSFLWIGNNDVLGYATLVEMEQILHPGAVGVGFDATYALVNTLMGLKGCWNIPYVNTLPFSRL